MLQRVADTPDLEAWARFTRLLADTRTSLRADDWPAGEEQAVAAAEHLADQSLCWLGWEVLHADPYRPAFQRHNDLVTQWGGPNADNVYRHARISPELRYRIRGNMHGCEDFLLALRKGFMHQETWGTVGQLSSNDREIGRGDTFEILLGGDAPDALPIPEGVVMVSVREYYHHWREEEPATWVIECLDEPNDGAPPVRPLDVRIDSAAGQIADSMRYWNQYMNDARSQRDANSFAAPIALAKGLSVARYQFCFWDLAPDEALIIETPVPNARYVSLQLYRLGTFEPIDLTRYVSSRNQTQLAMEDGALSAVISATDPGVSNWLETGGLPIGQCIFRWFWPKDDLAPEPSTFVCKTREVATRLPDAKRVSAEERTRERQSRLRHLQWRFRT